jgi:hypothetical protein
MYQAEIRNTGRTGHDIRILLKTISSEIAMLIFILKSFSFRTMTPGYSGIYDIFLRLIYQIGLALFRFEVYYIDSEKWYSWLLSSGAGLLETDSLMMLCRISDALVMVRRNICLLFIIQKVIDEYGVPAGLTIGELRGKTALLEHGRSYEQQVLYQKLCWEIYTEDYKRVTEIQDMLTKYKVGEYNDRSRIT